MAESVDNSRCGHDQFLAFELILETGIPQVIVTLQTCLLNVLLTCCWRHIQGMVWIIRIDRHQLISIGWGDGMEPNKRQAIIWTNVYQRMIYQQMNYADAIASIITITQTHPLFFLK